VLKTSLCGGEKFACSSPPVALREDLRNTACCDRAQEGCTRVRSSVVSELEKDAC
jgi:hypothetical protein